MGASALEIWRHASNVIQRMSYGGNGKKHFALQKKRMTDMASGGDGGSPTNVIMTDTSGHQSSIRDMHFDDWDDADFQSVLDIIAEWESTGELPEEPEPPAVDPIESAVERAAQIFKNLSQDDQVDALNALAIELGVMDPDDEAS